MKIFLCPLILLALIPFSCYAKVPQEGSKQSSVNIPIITEGWSDSPFLSRDGKRLYFMYSRYNFFPIFSGGMPKLAGPERVGLHKMHDGNPFSESDIYVSTCGDSGKFSNPIPVSFNEFGGDASGMEAGQSFYYIHTNNSSPDIYAARMVGNSKWMAPEKLPDSINTEYDEDNPYVSPDEQGIWFTSNRPGGYGGKDIYFSHKVNGVWTKAVNVGPIVNTKEDEDQIWINPVNMKEIYFNRGMTIYMTEWSNNNLIEPTPLTLPSVPMVAEISMSDDGRKMVFAIPNMQNKNITIMMSHKEVDGQWANPMPVDEVDCR